MSTLVLRTVLAERQIKSLRNKDLDRFRHFAHDLRDRGCAALGYRLTGPHPIGGICVKKLAGSLRVAVAFVKRDEALIISLGPHDRTNPHIDIYTNLYEIAGVNPPAGEGRAKPPCCDAETGLPKVLGEELLELVARARKFTSGRR